MQKKLLLNQNMNFANNIYWYRSGDEAILQGKKYKVVKNDLYLDADDSSLGMGEKTLLAFEWALENFDFDFDVCLGFRIRSRKLKTELKFESESENQHGQSKSQSRSKTKAK